MDSGIYISVGSNGTLVFEQDLEEPGNNLSKETVKALQALSEPLSKMFQGERVYLPELLACLDSNKDGIAGMYMSLQKHVDKAKLSEIQAKLTDEMIGKLSKAFSPAGFQIFAEGYLRVDFAAISSAVSSCRENVNGVAVMILTEWRKNYAGNDIIGDLSEMLREVAINGGYIEYSKIPSMFMEDMEESDIQAKLTDKMITNFSETVSLDDFKGFAIGHLGMDSVEISSIISAWRKNVVEVAVEVLTKWRKNYTGNDIIGDLSEKLRDAAFIDSGKITGIFT